MNSETPRSSHSPAKSPEMPTSSNPSPSSNGGSLPTARPIPSASSRLPRARRWSTKQKLLIGAAVVVALLTVFGGVVLASGMLFGGQVFRGQTFTVRREVLKVAIVARGSLESANNGDIYCKVRSGTKGSTNAT